MLKVQFDEQCHLLKQLQNETISRIVHQEMKEKYIERINEYTTALEVNKRLIQVHENTIQDLEFHINTLTNSKESVQIAVEQVIQENNQLKDQLFYNYIHQSDTYNSSNTSNHSIPTTNSSIILLPSQSSSSNSSHNMTMIEKDKHDKHKQGNMETIHETTPFSPSPANIKLPKIINNTHTTVYTPMKRNGK